MVFMTQEQAIKVSAKLLKNVFETNDPNNIDSLAAILCAEAEKNIDVLSSALDSVIEFCQELKTAMFNKT
jgi:hypothetical protein